MSKDSNYYIEQLTSGRWGVPDYPRPSSKGLSREDLDWVKAEVIDDMTIESKGTIVEVARTENPKFLFKKTKKSIGTINACRVRFLEKKNQMSKIPFKIGDIFTLKGEHNQGIPIKGAYTVTRINDPELSPNFKWSIDVQQNTVIGKMSSTKTDLYLASYIEEDKIEFLSKADAE